MIVRQVTSAKKLILAQKPVGRPMVVTAATAAQAAQPTKKSARHQPILTRTVIFQRELQVAVFVIRLALRVQQDIRIGHATAGSVIMVPLATAPTLALRPTSPRKAAVARHRVRVLAPLFHALQTVIVANQVRFAKNGNAVRTASSKAANASRQHATTQGVPKSPQNLNIRRILRLVPSHIPIAQQNPCMKIGLVIVAIVQEVMNAKSVRR